MENGYLARDKNGRLWWYKDKPIRRDESFMIANHPENGEAVAMPVYDDKFKDITWENSPALYATFKLEGGKQYAL